MQDKYNSLKKDLFKDSTYQMLVEGRNKECAKKGATQYTVVDTKTVECDGKKKDCPLFFDTDEFYCLNDPTDNDTWGGVTTTGIFTLNTLETPESLKKIVDENKLKAQLQHAIDALEESEDGGDDSGDDDEKEISITGVTYAIDAEQKITLSLTGENLDETKEYQWSIKVDEEAPVTRTSTGSTLEILATGDDELLNTSIQAGTDITATISVDEYTSEELTISKS
jgi:hypothetical protein